jgi:LysM repeat protein
MDEGIWQKRSRFLAQALIFSVAINIAFFATFTYFLLKDRGDRNAVSMTSTKTHQKSNLSTNPEVLQQYCEKNFQELVELLSDKELLEEGYQKRDFALAILSSFHQFDLERALGGVPLQKRQILFSIHPEGETFELAVFSGLTDEQYEAIIRFANTEKWPLTSEGLFFEIKRGFTAGRALDPKLIQAFIMSQEYLACATLFHRCSFEIGQEELIRFLVEGDWMAIKNIHECQARGDPLSMEHLHGLLLDYLQRRSKKAAKVLVAIDAEFALKRLADDQVLFVLDNIDLNEKKQYLFAKALLCSARGERVVRITAQKLYAHVGEQIPQDFRIIDAIRRFCPEALNASTIAAPMPEQEKKADAPKTSKSFRTYVVKEGDSLWKIAKRQHVSVEKIIEANSLQTEKLKVGQELKIPESR